MKKRKLKSEAFKGMTRIQCRSQFLSKIIRGEADSYSSSESSTSQYSISAQSNVEIETSKEN